MYFYILFQNNSGSYSVLAQVERSSAGKQLNNATEPIVYKAELM